MLVPSSCTQGVGLIASQSNETVPSDTHSAHHSYSHVAGTTDMLLAAGQEFPKGREQTSNHGEQAAAPNVQGRDERRKGGLGWQGEDGEGHLGGRGEFRVGSRGGRGRWRAGAPRDLSIAQNEVAQHS